SQLVHQPGSGACPDTGRSNKPYATTISSRSDFPKSMRPPKPNSVEPPWYGTRMPGGVGGVASRGVPLSRSTRVMLRPDLCCGRQGSGCFPWLEPQHKWSDG